MIERLIIKSEKKNTSAILHEPYSFGQISCILQFSKIYLWYEQLDQASNFS